MDMMDAAAAPASPSPEEVTVRSKFENALTFQPFLRSDSKGEISFECTASDKLSTYHVSVFAHDKDMRNALISRDMVVSIPVKVSVHHSFYVSDFSSGTGILYHRIWLEYVVSDLRAPGRH